MDWYPVVKTIKGRKYHYLQRTFREGKRVRTENKYVGPVVPKRGRVSQGRNGGSGNSGIVYEEERDPFDLKYRLLDQEEGAADGIGDAYFVRDDIPRRKSGILGVIDELVRKNKEPQETEEQVRERVAAEDREYAERDRINEALTADTISLDTISEIAASQAETVASETVAESADAATDAGESEAAPGEAGGDGEADGDGGEGSA